jgi:hypothetical protein
MIHQNNIILKYLLMTLLTMISSIYLINTTLPMYDSLTLALTTSISYALLDRILPSISDNRQN